jgi:hypothetical protein
MTKKRLEFDISKVRTFDPTNPKAVRDWAIYIKNGIAFAESNLPAWSAYERGQMKAVLNACAQTCQNIIDVYNTLDKLKTKDYETEAQRHL